MEKGNKLGSGSYGIVYKCLLDEESLAIKRNVTEKETDFIGVIRELDILYKLRSHPNILSLHKVSFGDPFKKECFSPLNKKLFNGCRDDKICFLFPEADCDLHSFIYRNDHTSFDRHKNIMIDILLGIRYMHHCGFIHRDLKPSNILLFHTKDGEELVAQLCDFGFSKPYTMQGSQTSGVVTVWYRAPEIVMYETEYDYKIDIWSIACIFFEMITKKNFVNINSSNSSTILTAIIRKIHYLLTEQDKKVIKNKFPSVSLEPKRKLTIKKHIGLSAQGIDIFNQTNGNFDSFCLLLEKMFSFDPKKRYDIDQCIEDTFFESHKNYINETKNCEIIPKEIPIKIVSCLERKWIAKFTTILFNERKNYVWYRHRILFQGLSMMDRYLVYKSKNKEEIKKINSSNYQGLFHDEQNTLLRFMACLYISIKYFNSIHVVSGFESLFKKFYKIPNAKLIVQNFEEEMIKHVLKYDVYRPTLYEIADKEGDVLTDNEIRDLIILYTCQTSFDGLTPYELYMIYKLHLKKKPLSSFMTPFDFKMYM